MELIAVKLDEDDALQREKKKPRSPGGQTRLSW